MDHGHRGVHPRPGRPVPRGVPALSYDVAVVGAGICGAACALELAERGAKVLLADRGVVSGGTTGLGEGNVLVSDKRAGPELALALAGRAMWDELIARFPDATRARRKGAIVLFEHDGAPAFADRLGAAGVECRVVQAPHEVEPCLARDLPPAIVVPGELQVDPRALTRALARDAAARGAVIREGWDVAAVRKDRIEGVDGESVAASAVVVAAGPWSASLLAGLPLEPRKGQLLAVSAPAGMIHRKLYEAAYMDTIESPAASLQVAAVVEQTLDGDEVLVGSSRERVGFDTRVDEGVLDAMLARAARFVPGLAQLDRTRAWAGLRPWLPDGLPAVGMNADGVYVCTGHEGAGIGLGPISGRIVAQLITSEPPVVDPTPFSPTRFGGLSVT